MKSELLDKEVLCILDTRQIQRYIFRANSFLDILGGSDLILHILDDAILYALHNIDEPLSEEEYDISRDPDEKIGYFTSEKVKFQLIMCIAGNALCIVRTGALCQKLIRKISRYYLEHAYSLNLTVAVTEKTEDFGRDIFHLYKNLNAIKSSSETSVPLGTLPVVIHEKRTGEPAIAIDERTGDYISRTSFLRRSEAWEREYVLDFKDLRTTKAFNKKEYKAVIHADGNNLGITIGRILQRTPGYEEGIATRRRINKTIDDSMTRVVKNAIQDIRAYYLSEGGSEEEFQQEFCLIHKGGDDVNVMCNANMAFQFAEAFYRHLETACIWDTPEEKIPLYACMGIAFITPENSIHRSFELAEECCKSAKTMAKKEENLRNGLAGNWIDFQLCDNPNAQELDILRKQLYITGENINLLMRPYCMDREAKDEVYSYDLLMKRARDYRKLHLNDEIQNLMRRSYGIGRQFFTQCVGMLEEEGIHLQEQLGAPLYYQNKKQPRAVWYDAVELSDFVKEKER